MTTNLRSSGSGGEDDYQFSWTYTDRLGDHHVRLSAARDGTDASLLLDSPAEPMVLTLHLNADGLQELTAQARPGGALQRKHLKAFPLTMTADVALLVTEILHAISSADTESEPLWVTPAGVSVDHGLRQILDMSREHSRRRRQGRTRGELRREVVREYRAAIADQHPAPRKRVAERLGYSTQYVAQLLAEARRPEIAELEPTTPGRKNRPAEETP